MVKGHGLLLVTKQTESGDGAIRTSYYSRMLGIRAGSVFIANLVWDSFYADCSLSLGLTSVLATQITGGKGRPRSSFQGLGIRVDRRVNQHKRH